MTTQTPQSWWNKPGNLDFRWLRSQFDNTPSAKEDSETFTQER